MQDDAALDLYHGAIARVYDPATGRWTSPDPEGIKAGDANLNRFAGNQTTTHTDTSGLWWLTDAWNAVTTGRCRHGQRRGNSGSQRLHDGGDHCRRFRGKIL